MISLSYQSYKIFKIYDCAKDGGEDLFNKMNCVLCFACMVMYSKAARELSSKNLERTIKFTLILTKLEQTFPICSRKLNQRLGSAAR